MDLKERIAKLLSELLSDQFECNITIKIMEDKKDVRNLQTDNLPVGMSECTRTNADL